MRIQGLISCRKGTEPTFERTDGRGHSAVDVTLASETLRRCVREWKVSEEETMSDHRYVTYRIDTKTAMENGEQGIRHDAESHACGRRRWAVRTLQVEKFEAKYRELEPGRQTRSDHEVSRGEEEEQEQGEEQTDVGPERAEEMAIEIQRRLSSACEVTMRRVGPANDRKPKYWWSDEIAR